MGFKSGITDVFFIRDWLLFGRRFIAPLRIAAATDRSSSIKKLFFSSPFHSSVDLAGGAAVAKPTARISSALLRSISQ